MKSLLNMFLKFVLLLVAITGALAGNIQDLPPCCVPYQPCDPIFCKHLPCCRDRPPPSDMNPKLDYFIPIILYLRKVYLIPNNYINKIGW